MRETTKGIAFTVVLAMLVVNFVLPRPVVPTLPHESWHWLTPWPVQVVKASTNDWETLIEIGVAIELAREFLVGLERLALENLYGAARDWLEGGGSTSPTGGGGGGADQ